MNSELADIIGNDFELQIKINDSFNNSQNNEEALKNFKNVLNASTLSDDHKEELSSLGDKLIAEKKNLEEFSKTSVIGRLDKEFDQILQDVPGKNSQNLLINEYCESIKNPVKKEKFLKQIDEKMKTNISEIVDSFLSAISCFSAGVFPMVESAT